MRYRSEEDYKNEAIEKFSFGHDQEKIDLVQKMVDEMPSTWREVCGYADIDVYPGYTDADLEDELRRDNAEAFDGEDIGEFVKNQDWNWSDPDGIVSWWI